MNPVPSAVLFALDAGLVLVAAWWLALLLQPAGAGRLERLAGWLLGVPLIVVASAEVLGWCGLLGREGFLFAHALIAGGLGVAVRAKRLPLVPQFGWPGGEDRTLGWLLGLMLVMVLGLALLAARTNPLVFDALTYRLPRAALWLQEGRVMHFATDDARLNYMAPAPDLFAAWLLGARQAGYDLTALGQTLSGCLLLLATMGLARLTGLSQRASAGAAFVLLALSPAAAQFTSAYTDLFAGGVIAAALYLWLAAARRGKLAALGAMGAALAVASKGTLVYFVPSLLLWLAWWQRRHPLPARCWGVGLAWGALAAAVIVWPGWARNGSTYRGVAGPAESVRQHHGEWRGTAAGAEKLWLNLRSSLALNLAPVNQPWPVDRAGGAAPAALAAGLPAQDAYAFEDFNRRERLRQVLALTEPDADVAAPGWPVPLLALLAGLAASVWRGMPGAGGARWWLAGVALFVVTLHGMALWHPYLLRFTVLVAPWIAVLAVWGASSLTAWRRTAAWTLLAVLAAGGLWQGAMKTYQAGWPALAAPQRALSFVVFASWRTWSRELTPLDEPLHLALPVNRPLAAFLRLPENRPVRVHPLEALRGRSAAEAVAGLDGWLVVPAGFFAGREERVERRAWSFDGNPAHEFSLAAYRRVATGSVSSGP